MSRKETRWLLAVVMVIVMMTTVFASPLTARAEGEEGEAPAKYINSDGQEIAVQEENGFVFGIVDNDGEEAAEVYGYTEKGDTINVPGTLGGKPVTSFAIDPRWPLDREEYEQIKTICLPASIQCAHSKFMNYFGGLEEIHIADGNEKYFSDDRGILFKRNEKGSQVAAYPRASKAKEFIMPKDMNVFYRFYEGCPVEKLVMSAKMRWFRYFSFENLKELKTLEVDEDNPFYYAKDNVLFERETSWDDYDDEESAWRYTGDESLIYYPARLTAAEYAVPDGIDEIDTGAFMHNQSTYAHSNFDKES